jgi:lipopolysaccharide export system permease protein
LSGIIIVFSAFTNMDELLRQAQDGSGLPAVLLHFYGPKLLWMFDATGAIIALMSVLFTVSFLRRRGELSAMLSAGIPHGRIFRAMVIASAAIVVLQVVNREIWLPKFRDALSMKAKDMALANEQPVLAQYDKINRVLIDGESMIVSTSTVKKVNLRLDGDFAGFGELVLGSSAQWMQETNDRPGGYLINDVSRPEKIDQLKSIIIDNRPILVTRKDWPQLQSGQCFFATTVGADLLLANEASTKFATLGELVKRVRNPAIHSSSSLYVLLHSRFIRPPLDIALIMLVLPMAVNSGGRNLFVMMGAALGTVLLFFALKSLASAMGGSGYLIGPAMAAWVPLLLIGPVAYNRLRMIQTL